MAGGCREASGRGIIMLAPGQPYYHLSGMAVLADADYDSMMKIIAPLLA